MTAFRTSDTVNPNDVGSYVFTNNTDITSSSGSHLFYIGGSGDTLTSTGSSEMVLANGGNNTVNLSGLGNNTVYISGGNNFVNTGHGNSAITDSVGTGDTIVMQNASFGFDAITLLVGADVKLDFSTALKGTNWGGNVSDLASYISVTDKDGTATISLSATAHGAGVAVASVYNPQGSAWNESTVLTHTIS